MNLTFSGFEAAIDSTIVKRGLEYYRESLVCDLEEVDDGAWSALVSGTDDYEVKIKIDKEKIADCDCTCPYDFGPVCKHVVAVIYAIKAELGGNIDEISNQKTRKKVSKPSSRMTTSDKINEVLGNMPHEELLSVVRNYAIENREFRNAIFTKALISKGGEADKSQYCRIIRDSLRAAGDRHGFIDYGSTRHAVKGAEELLSHAEALVNEEKFEETIPICQAVIEEVVPALQNSDDSNGELGSVIEDAFGKLSHNAEMITDEKTRKKMFEYCLIQVVDERYNGWSDWQWQFLHIAITLLSCASEEKILLDKADELCKLNQNKNSYSDYHREEAVSIKMAVIERHKDEKEMERFIAENMHYTSIRRMAIKDAFEQKEFNRMKILAQEGIVQDEKRKLGGLVVEWLIWLLKSAEAEKDQKSTRKYAKILFNERFDFEYYDKLKQTYSIAEWKKEIDNILTELAGNTHRYNTFHTIGKIFTREKMWNNLLDLIKKDPSLYTLEEYYQYLSLYFPDETVALYEDAIKKSLIKVADRKHYEEICRILKKIKKLDVRENVDNIIKELKLKYKNRPALMDELGKV